MAKLTLETPTPGIYPSKSCLCDYMLVTTFDNIYFFSKISQRRNKVGYVPWESVPKTKLSIGVVSAVRINEALLRNEEAKVVST